MEDEKLELVQEETVEPAKDEVTNESAPEKSKDTALVEMSKKLKEKDRELREYKEKAKVADEMTEQYTSLLMETKKSEVQAELHNFAQTFGIADNVMDSILNKYKPEDLIKSSGTIEKKLIADNYEVLKPFIMGTGKQVEKPAEPPINLATASGSFNPANDKVELARKAIEDYNARTLSVFGRKK
jgi:hypothetical protein